MPRWVLNSYRPNAAAGPQRNREDFPAKSGKVAIATAVRLMSYCTERIVTGGNCPCSRRCQSPPLPRYTWSVPPRHRPPLAGQIKERPPRSPCRRSRWSRRHAAARIGGRPRQGAGRDPGADQQRHQPRRQCRRAARAERAGVRASPSTPPPATRSSRACSITASRPRRCRATRRGSRSISTARASTSRSATRSIGI